jgi:hypothetical protein
MNMGLSKPCWGQMRQVTAQCDVYRPKGCRPDRSGRFSLSREMFGACRDAIDGAVDMLYLYILQFERLMSCPYNSRTALCTVTTEQQWIASNLIRITIQLQSSEHFSCTQMPLRILEALNASKVLDCSQTPPQLVIQCMKQPVRPASQENASH